VSFAYTSPRHGLGCPAFSAGSDTPVAPSGELTTAPPSPGNRGSLVRSPLRPKRHQSAFRPGTPSWALTPPAASAGLAPSLCRPFQPPDLLPELGSFPPTKCHSSGYSHLLGTTLRQATHTGSGRPFGLYRDCSTHLGLPGPPNRLAPGRRRGPYTL